jgi:prostaglandin-endoperoxide synthase 2
MAQESGVKGRDTSADGRKNIREFKLLTGYGLVWKIVQRQPKLEKFVNGKLIDSASSKMPYRPNPDSTLADYTSWASLTDRKYWSRHLPPVESAPEEPKAEKVAELFVRDEGKFIPSDKSTVLFSYFAQWFTDGFLRSDRAPEPDDRRNDTNHEIDLMQIYGLTPDVTDQLRLHEGGLLRSQMINGEEYPEYAYDANGKKKPEYSLVPDVPTKLAPKLTPEILSKFFAVGSDTSNLQLGFVLMNVLFFREHNRVARELAAKHPEWKGDDDRLFETARNILIVLLIKIVVEEYINHITPYHFGFRANPASFKNPAWYRPNWMAVEFNLVYRWHPLVPPTYRIAGDDVPVLKTLYETDLLTKNGLGQLFEDASNQAAGKIGLFNTDPVLGPVQLWSVNKGRNVRLASYNDYRELCGYPRVTAFNQISGDPKVQNGLSELYKTVDDIEFFPGLYAEDIRPNSVLPSLIGRMVGIDAFSQALTNPLLSPRVFNEATFSPAGMEIIGSTNTLSDILHRNIPGDEKRFVGMTRRDWKRSRR